MIASAFGIEENGGESKFSSRPVSSQSAKMAVEESQSHIRAAVTIVIARLRDERQNNMRDRIINKIECERGKIASDNHFFITKIVIQKAL